MVEGVMTSNGTAPRVLPAEVRIDMAESGRVPSPGTLRRLKAETGFTWEAVMGEKAEDADKFQTLIWVALRRNGYPDVAWGECADVELVIEQTVRPPDPFVPEPSAPSPPSVGSGV